MSTISNISIIMQQGDSAAQANNPRNQPVDISQAISINQPEKDFAKRTTVQHHDDSDGTKLNKDGSGKNKREMSQKRKKSRDSRKDNVYPKDVGKLLDTLA